MPVQGAAFVAKSATVADGVQVAGNAKVVHWAVVRGQVRILDDAVVGHHARVFGGPGPQGAVHIHGTAQVDGHATVGAGADIATRRHLLTVTGLGPNGHTLTAYRAHPERWSDGDWRWGVGVHLSGWFGDLDDLDDRIKRGDLGWTEDELRELDIALDIVAERLGYWQAEDVTNADRRRWQLRDSDLRRAGVRATRGGRIPAGEVTR